MPVVASGDITSRARAQAVLATTGAAAVMVGRAAQGNPWALREIVDGRSPAEPTREEVVAELMLFMRETVRELGERARDRLPEEVLRLVPRPRPLPAPVQAGARRSSRRSPRSRSGCCRRPPGRRGAGAAGGRAARGRGRARPADLDLRRRLARTGGGPERARNEPEARLLEAEVRNPLDAATRLAASAAGKAAGARPGRQSCLRQLRARQEGKARGPARTRANAQCTSSGVGSPYLSVLTTRATDATMTMAAMSIAAVSSSDRSHQPSSTATTGLTNA